MNPSKRIIAYFLIFAFLTAQIASKLKPSKIKLAINCGGGDLKTPSGIQYKADEYYDGGESSDFGSNQDVRLTKDSEVYYTERWSKTDFSYNLPVTEDGSYVLILQFSEVYFSSKNEKVFDVELNGKKIIKDLDIFEKVGKLAAFEEFIAFTIKDGKIIMKGENISFDGKNIGIKFVKKEKDNPKINGIVLVKGTLDDTHYSDYNDLLENEDKIKTERERKHRDFKRMSKSIDFEDFEDDFVDDGRFNVGGSGMFSIKGLIVCGVIASLGYFLFFK